MTDYAKWDKFAAELDSDSDEVEPAHTSSIREKVAPPNTTSRKQYNETSSSSTSAATTTSYGEYGHKLGDAGGSSTLELSLLAQKYAEVCNTENTFHCFSKSKD